MKKSVTWRGWGRVLLLLFFLTFGEKGVQADIGFVLPPLQDEEIRGFRLEDFVLVPSLGLELRYNSNLFRQADVEGPTKASILSIVPGIALANASPNRLKLKWDAFATINQYFSDDPHAKDQGHFGASSSFRADFLPRSVVGFFVADRFVREQLPPNLSSSLTYDRNANHAEVGVQIRPGGGALEFALSYSYDFLLYDDRSDLDFWFHQGRLLGTWQLMPKTAILLDANFQYRTWRRPLRGLRTDSAPLRLQAGLRGLITRKVAVVLLGGFGKGFYKEGGDFAGFIGEAGVGFLPTNNVTLEVGYRRNFEDSYWSNYYTGDSAYLKAGFQIARRVNLVLQGEYTYASYAYLDPSVLNTQEVTYWTNQASRRDHAVRGEAMLTWALIRFLSLDIGYRFDALLTDFRITANGQTDYSRYKVHQVFGRLSAYY